MIGLRVGKAIVIGDSAAFSSTLLGINWSGSAHDLADITGVEVPFAYLNLLLRGQLGSAEPAMRYRYDAGRELWVTQYPISRGRKVAVGLNRDLHVQRMTISDPKEVVQIFYSNIDDRTGYPRKLDISLKSQPDYTVSIEITDIRTEGLIRHHLVSDERIGCIIALLLFATFLQGQTKEELQRQKVLLQDQIDLASTLLKQTQSSRASSITQLQTLNKKLRLGSA